MGSTGGICCRSLGREYNFAASCIDKPPGNGYNKDDIHISEVVTDADGNIYEHKYDKIIRESRLEVRISEVQKSNWSLTRCIN